MRIVNALEISGRLHHSMLFASFKTPDHRAPKIYASEKCQLIKAILDLSAEIFAVALTE
jgi:hypothetical protein